MKRSNRGPKSKRDREARKQSEPAAGKLTASLLVVLVAFSATVWGFWLLWEDNAVDLRSQDAESLSREGDVVTVNHETTIVFENYLPGTRSFRNWFEVLSRDFQNRTQSRQVIFRQPQLEENNIQINGTTVQGFYGDVPLGPPDVRTDDFFAARWRVSGLLELHLTINWSFKQSRNQTQTVRLVSEVRIDVPPSVEEEPLFEPAIRLQRVEQSLYFYVLRVAVPIASFTFLGFVLGLYLRARLGPLPKRLLQLAQVSQGAGPPSRLEPLLRELTYRLNSLSYFWTLILAAAVMLLKLSVRMKVIRWLNLSRFHRQGLEDELKTFLKDPATKPATGLFELRTIGLIFGLLASVGLSFTFNAGAIGPLLLAAGVTYLSLNFGFFLFVMRKVRADRIRVAIFVLLTAIVVASPRIVQDLRLL